jgi:N-methylhydantoinase A
MAAASVMRTIANLQEGDLPLAALETTMRAVRGKNEGEGSVKYFARARYAGQGHELDVEISPVLGAESIRERFVARHRERFGFVLDRDVEVVSVRCMLATGGRDVRLARRGPSGWSDDHRVDEGGVMSSTVAGRATVELPDATLLVAPGWLATSVDIGGWLVEKQE